MSTNPIDGTPTASNQLERLRTEFRKPNERMRDHTMVGISRLIKSRDRARYRVAEMALADPAVWARIEPLLSAPLAAIGKDLRHIADYQESVKLINELKELLG